MEPTTTIAIYPSPDGSGSSGGVTFIPTYIPPLPPPHVCPSCGRCRSCGAREFQPAPILNPWPQYVEPLWLVDPNTGPFYGSVGVGYASATLT